MGKLQASWTQVFDGVYIPTPEGSTHHLPDYLNALLDQARTRGRDVDSETSLIPYYISYIGCALAELAAPRPELLAHYGLDGTHSERPAITSLIPYFSCEIEIPINRKQFDRKAIATSTARKLEQDVAVGLDIGNSVEVQVHPADLLHVGKAADQSLHAIQRNTSFSLQEVLKPGCFLQRLRGERKTAVNLETQHGTHVRYSLYGMDAEGCMHLLSADASLPVHHDSTLRTYAATQEACLTISNGQPEVFQYMRRIRDYGDSLIFGKKGNLSFFPLMACNDKEHNGISSQTTELRLPYDKAWNAGDDQLLKGAFVLCAGLRHWAACPRYVVECALAEPKENGSSAYTLPFAHTKVEGMHAFRHGDILGLPTAFDAHGIDLHDSMTRAVAGNALSPKGLRAVNTILGR